MAADGDKLRQVKITYLSEADAQALDAALAAGHGADETDERQAQVRRLLSLLDHCHADEPSEDLVAQTIARAQNVRQQERFAQQVQMLGGSAGSIGVSWRQILAAAAVFLLGLSLLMPVLERQQRESRRVACASNLGVAGQSMQQYAAAHNQAMPRGPVRPGDFWWNVGQPAAGENEPIRSNSAHLYILVRSRFLDADILTCPSNLYAPLGQMTAEHRDWNRPQEVSFSYQNQYTAQPLRLDLNPDLAVLADRNPLFIVQGGRIVYDQGASPASPSRVHGSRGQNVLSAGGNVAWTIRPLVPHRQSADNFWTAVGVDQYTGRETPAEPDDSFLVP
jgi:hypothetical protein